MTTGVIISFCCDNLPHAYDAETAFIFMKEICTTIYLITDKAIKSLEGKQEVVHFLVDSSKALHTYLRFIMKSCDKHLVLYYSGHGHGNGMQVGSSIYSYIKLRKLLDGGAAKEVIVFQDTCNSNSMQLPIRYDEGGYQYQDELICSPVSIITINGKREDNKLKAYKNGSSYTRRIFKCIHTTSLSKIITNYNKMSKDEQIEIYGSRIVSELPFWLCNNIKVVNINGKKVYCFPDSTIFYITPSIHHATDTVLHTSDTQHTIH